MAFIPHRTAEIGDTVKLLKPVTVYNGTFEVGTIVKIIDKTDDGFRISDEDGHTASGIEIYDIAVVGGANPEKKDAVNADTERPKASEPNKDGWIYETGREEPEILGSGSHYYNTETTCDEEEAFKRLNDGYNNYLIRYKRSKEKGRLREQQQYWNRYAKKWSE